MDSLGSTHSLRSFRAEIVRPFTPNPPIYNVLNPKTINVIMGNSTKPSL